MVSYWLMSPQEIYDSTRIGELETMTFFGLGVEVEPHLYLSSRQLDFLAGRYKGGEGEKTRIIRYEKGKIVVPLGNQIFISNDDLHRKTRPETIATMERASVGPLSDILEDSLPEDLFVFGSSIVPRDGKKKTTVSSNLIVSCYHVTGSYLASGSEAMDLIKARCSYELDSSSRRIGLDQKD